MIKGGKLKRHITRKHKMESEIQSILKKDKNEQNKFFEKKRIDGIYEYNSKILKETPKKDTLLRERNSKTADNSRLRMCSRCKKFVDSKWYYHHRKTCSVDAMPVKPIVLGITLKEISCDKEFVEILSNIQEGEVGEICRTDELIQIIGYRHFSLRRGASSKRNEIAKQVRTEMRTLARLFQIFRTKVEDTEITAKDMFVRKHMSEFRESIEELSRDKHGLQLNLHSTIQRTLKVLSNWYSELGQDDMCLETERFQRSYNFRSFELYGDARNKAQTISFSKSRNPESMPSMENIVSLKMFIQSEIDKVLAEENFDYCWARSLAVTRLTIFNARRGEEPSRLLLKEWQDAKDGKWLGSGKQLEEEQYLSKYKLAYLHGKGKRYVPLLIPDDLETIMDKLSDPTERKRNGIKAENSFLFATKFSGNHCSGWHAVTNVVVCSGVDIKINATTMRHYVSTLYSSLDMDPTNRDVFLAHMGHEESVNKNVYTAPMGVREIRVMSKFLEQAETVTG